MENLIAPGRLSFKIRTSSVLKRSGEFAGKNMADGKEETCWNSDQGSPQWILIEFPGAVTLSRVCIMFQGGFVGGLMRGRMRWFLRWLQSWFMGGLVRWRV